MRLSTYARAYLPAHSYLALPSVPSPSPPLPCSLPLPLFAIPTLNSSNGTWPSRATTRVSNTASRRSTSAVKAPPLPTDERATGQERGGPHTQDRGETGGETGGRKGGKENGGRNGERKERTEGAGRKGGGLKAVRQAEAKGHYQPVKQTGPCLRPAILAQTPTPTPPLRRTRTLRRIPPLLQHGHKPCQAHTPTRHQTPDVCVCMCVCARASSALV